MDGVVPAQGLPDYETRDSADEGRANLDNGDNGEIGVEPRNTPFITLDMNPGHTSNHQPGDIRDAILPLPSNAPP